MFSPQFKEWMYSSHSYRAHAYTQKIYIEADIPDSATHLNHTHVSEQCIVRCGSKNRYRKDPRSNKSICLKQHVFHFKLNNEHDWGNDLYIRSFNEHENTDFDNNKEELHIGDRRDFWA